VHAAEKNAVSVPFRLTNNGYLDLGSVHISCLLQHVEFGNHNSIDDMSLGGKAEFDLPRLARNESTDMVCPASLGALPTVGEIAISVDYRYSWIPLHRHRLFNFSGRQLEQYEWLSRPEARE
jgi:hypothetical protein